MRFKNLTLQNEIFQNMTIWNKKGELFYAQ